MEQSESILDSVAGDFGNQIDAICDRKLAELER
jgi:hypothetical protein